MVHLVLLFFLSCSLICSGEEAKLFSAWSSSCSWRVRIALNIKEIPYEYISYDSISSKEEYLRLNPLGKVPTLCIDGIALSQSLAIIEYLEETRPEHSLLPEDPVLRAHARMIAQMIVSDIQPLQNKAVLRMFPEEESLLWARHWIHKGLSAVERVLESTAGRFCVGDQITMADLCLIPQVWNATRYGVELASFPNIQKVCGNLEENPSFQITHPDVQVDRFN